MKYKNKQRLGLVWSSYRRPWMRVWCLFGIHSWLAINGGPFGYLLPDAEGNHQRCWRCGKRRFSERRAGEAIRWLADRLDEREEKQHEAG